VLDRYGVALRGVLLRHLVMPGCTVETAEIMRWAARELGPETYVNLIFQYRPAGRVTGHEYKEIDRCTTANEFQQAVHSFYSVGLHRFSVYSVAQAEEHCNPICFCSIITEACDAAVINRN
jgi:putative pyruvate formate lyase activating enzyme